VRDWESKKSALLNLIDQNQFEYDEHIETDFHKWSEDKGYEMKIQDLLTEELKLFCKSFGFSQYSVNQAWFEKASQNDYHDVHNHGPFGYSSVCFIEFDKDDHQATKFIAPFNNFLNGLPLTHCPDVEEGSIIFFPSSTLHYTKPNKSLKQRIILSFNLNVG
jgi:hypothetical protein